jgi:hypothetical protein
VEIECSEKVQTATIFKTRLSTVRLINKHSNDRLETKPVDKNAVIEWAPFTLVEGIDEEKLLQASQLMGADHAEPGAGVMHFEQVKTYKA